MDVFIGIDLGSTTTKAVVLDENANVIGRGITNSRSNYDVAAKVVREEAMARTRLTLMHASPEMERTFRLRQHLDLLERLREAMLMSIRGRKLASEILDISDEMVRRAPKHFLPGATRRRDFFRDLAAADFMQLAEGPHFDALCGIFDAAILAVENITIENAFERYAGDGSEDPSYVEPLNVVATVGTGYGRQRLPFPKEKIRSEILCHGLGAHAMFPGTRTVLDIGGQDTKAIQLDSEGIVTSFQMNDRCAAGCGRYLGYIADEMNLGVHELGPLAQQSRARVKINSTCTVFAGAELRERLSLGQAREDILAGLHRAIILRAMSLLARSGGIADQFTFTGGVAKNPAAVAALQQLVRENYGERTLNTSSDSIYTGALGAALFARRKAA